MSISEQAAEYARKATAGLPRTDPGPAAPAQLQELLRRVEHELRRYVVMSEDATTIATLWVAHVFAFAAFEFTPYLAVTSATKRSGKSRLLEVLEVILGENKSVSTANISAPSLFRLIDANPGLAVLFDEMDRISKDRAEDLWGLINSGWRLGGKAHRQTGVKMETLKAFSTFAPKVLAGIGSPLPDTTADRSLKVRMERRLPSEKVERLRLRQASADIGPVRTALTEWGAREETIDRLKRAEPVFPPGLTNDRLMDVTEPLFAIADLAGGDWPERIRRAVLAQEDVGGQIADEDVRILALRHVAQAFAEKGATKIATVDLLTYMVARDDGPWAEWWGDAVDRGKIVAPAQRLGKLLSGFDQVIPKSLRIGQGPPVRGYEIRPVAAAIERYLPHPSVTSVTPVTSLASSVTDVADVTDTPGSFAPGPEPSFMQPLRDAAEQPESDPAVALALVAASLDPEAET